MYIVQGFRAFVGDDMEKEGGSLSSAMSTVREIFSNEDLDRDGLISKEEYLKVKLRGYEDSEEQTKKKDEL